MPEPGTEAADLLQDEDPRIRARAAQTLIEHGVSGAALLEDRAFDPDPEVRMLAVRLLVADRSAAAEEVLLSALGDDCREVAIAAAEVLAARRPARAADAVTECFTSRPELQGPLALALAHLGDPGVEELLWVTLEEAGPATRRSLLQALGACGGPRSVPSLLSLIESASGDDLLESLAALAEIRERAPDRVDLSALPDAAGSAWPRLLESADPRWRRAGISLARVLASRESLVALLDRVTDPDAEVASRALAAIVDAAARCEDSLLAALGGRSPEVATAVLDRIRTLSGEEARRSLLSLLESPEPRVREAVAALAGRSHLGGLAPSLTQLLSDGDGHVRARAAEALGALGEAGARPHVAGLLQDPYPDVREAALHALRALPDDGTDPVPDPGAARPGARAMLVRALDLRHHSDWLDGAVADGDPDVRLAALANLAERGVWNDAASPLLLDEDPRVRAHAVRARLLARPIRPLEPLRPLLHDPDPGVRQALATGFSLLPGPVGLPWLCEVCRDPNAAVARAAVRGLARHRDPESVRALLDLLSTAGLPVRRAAIEALGEIGDRESLPRLRAVARGGDGSLRGPAAAAARRVEGARR
jgi:HEAT repeat protein